MVDTIRTDAAILAVLPDNNTYQITPQNIRDFAVTAFAKGGINIEQYGAVSGTGLSSGQRTANTTAINNAVAAASTAGVPVLIFGKTYEINGTIDLTGMSDVHIVGLGLDASASQLIQITDNIPIFKIGATSGFAEGVTIERLFMTYLNRQVGNTSAVAMFMQSCFMCSFRDLKIVNAYDGIAGTPATLSVFSCEFSNIEVRSWVNWGVNLDSTAGSSGNFIQNVYCNASISLTPFDDYAVTGCFRINNCATSYFAQLNLEAAICSDAALALWSVKQSIVNAVNIEQISSAGGHGLILVVTAHTFISAVIVINCRFRTTDGATAACVLLAADSTTTILESLTIESVTVSGLTFYIIQSSDLGSGTPDSTVYLHSYTLRSGHSVNGIANTLVSAGSTIKRDPLVEAGSAMGLGQGIFTQGNADVDYYPELYPRYMRFNTALTAIRNCNLKASVQSATTVTPPKGATVVVWRTSAATGAFNLLVKNAAATTIATLAAAGNGAECVFNGSDWETIRTW